MKPTLFAILAAALYAAGIPVSKILLKDIEPTLMAAFLYLGAGIGVFLLEGAKVAFYIMIAHSFYVFIM